MAKQIDVTLANGDKAGETLKALTFQAAALNKEIKNLKPGTQEFIVASQSLNQVKERMGDIDKQVKNTGKSMEELDKKGQGLQSGFSKLTGVLAATFAVDRIKAFIGGVIDITSEFQKFSAVLTNTLGSKSAAQRALNMIQDFAAKTPFSVRELTDSYVKLANQGFKPTEVEMRKIGDLASATGKNFDQLTEAFLDAQTGQFERLKEFGIKASKHGDQVTFSFKGVETQVDYTNEAMGEYLLSLGDVVGVSGSMAAVSETLGGQISNLGDSWDNFLRTVGDGNKGVLSGAVSLLSNLLSTATKFLKTTEQQSDDRVSKSTNTALSVYNKSDDKDAAKQAIYERILKLQIEVAKNDRLNQENIKSNGYGMGMQGVAAREELAKRNLDEIKGLQSALEQIKQDSDDLEKKLGKKTSVKPESEKDKKKREAKEKKDYNADLKEDKKDSKLLDSLDKIEAKGKEAKDKADLKRQKDKAKKSMLTAVEHVQNMNDTYAQDHENYKKIELSKQQIQDESLDVFNQGANTLTSILGSTVEERKKNAAAIKAIEAGQVLINGYAEVAELAKQYAKLGPGIGQVLAAIQIGFSVARTASAVASINAQQFYSGGYTGDGGKYQPAGVVHAGEVVWSQEDVARFGGVRAVESIRPTAMRGYYTGGPVNPLESQTSNPSIQPTSVSFDYNKLAEVFDKRIDNKIKLIKSKVVITDIKDGLDTYVTLKREADV